MPDWVRYLVLAALVVFGTTGAIVELGREFAGETAVRLVLSGLVSGGLAALAWYVVLWHLERLRRRTHVS